MVLPHRTCRFKRPAVMLASRLVFSIAVWDIMRDDRDYGFW